MEGVCAIDVQYLEAAVVDVYSALLRIEFVLRTNARPLAFLGGVHLLKLGAKRYTKDIDVELRIQKEPGLDREVVAMLEDDPCFENVEVTWETQNVGYLSVLLLLHVPTPTPVDPSALAWADWYRHHAI